MVTPKLRRRRTPPARPHEDLARELGPLRLLEAERELAARETSSQPPPHTYAPSTDDCDED